MKAAAANQVETYTGAILRQFMTGRAIFEMFFSGRISFALQAQGATLIFFGESSHGV